MQVVRVMAKVSPSRVQHYTDEDQGYLHRVPRISSSALSY